MTLYTRKGLLKLAEVVQNARFNKGLTQKDVAEGCGLGIATVSRLESGDSVKTPTDTTLEKIAQFIGLTRDELKAIAEERREYSNGARTVAMNDHNGTHNSVVEIISKLDQLTEAQLDLVFREIINHPSMHSQRLIRYARMLMDRLDSLG